MLRIELKHGYRQALCTVAEKRVRDRVIPRGSHLRFVGNTGLGIRAGDSEKW